MASTLTREQIMQLPPWERLKYPDVPAYTRAQAMEDAKDWAQRYGLWREGMSIRDAEEVLRQAGKWTPWDLYVNQMQALRNITPLDNGEFVPYNPADFGNKRVYEVKQLPFKEWTRPKQPPAPPPPQPPPQPPVPQPSAQPAAQQPAPSGSAEPRELTPEEVVRTLPPWEWTDYDVPQYTYEMSLRDAVAWARALGIPLRDDFIQTMTPEEAKRVEQWVQKETGWSPWTLYVNQMRSKGLDPMPWGGWNTYLDKPPPLITTLYSVPASVSPIPPRREPQPTGTAQPQAAPQQPAAQPPPTPPAPPAQPVPQQPAGQQLPVQPAQPQAQKPPVPPPPKPPQQPVVPPPPPPPTQPPQPAAPPKQPQQPAPTATAPDLTAPLPSTPPPVQVPVPQPRNNRPPNPPELPITSRVSPMDNTPRYGRLPELSQAVKDAIDAANIRYNERMQMHPQSFSRILRMYRANGIPITPEAVASAMQMSPYWERRGVEPMPIGVYAQAFPGMGAVPMAIAARQQMAHEAALADLAKQRMATTNIPEAEAPQAMPQWPSVAGATAGMGEAAAAAGAAFKQPEPRAGDLLEQEYARAIATIRNQIMSLPPGQREAAIQALLGVLQR